MRVRDELLGGGFTVYCRDFMMRVSISFTASLYIPAFLFEGFGLLIFRPHAPPRVCSR